MQQAWRFASATYNAGRLTASSYGYGLRIASDCRFAHIVGHGGGLPGFGSYESWLPDYGVGVITFANLTYTGLRSLHDEVYDALLATGALTKRMPLPSPALLAVKDDISKLITQWDPSLAQRLAADNLFLDDAAEVRRSKIADLTSKVGACKADPGIDAENALRGQWRMTCERGSLFVRATLAPTMPPKVQFLDVRSEEFPKVETCKP
jgi:hypothetical protein